MLNNPKLLFFLIISTLFLAACGDSDTPKTSSSGESATNASETQTMTTESPQQAMASGESMPAPEMTTVAAPVPAETTTVETVAAETTEAETPAAETTSNKPVDGGEIYNTYCAICHKLGMNAAPKYGNKALWAKRIAQGRETVYSHAINGLRGMPPRGGFANLTDEEIKAGVDYMVKAAGGWQD